ncbi:MAG: UbiA prenyltransferase family protein [Prevotella sp.]|nr:UbiA prenyltransferase family protein [Prevotella sp.]
MKNYFRLLRCDQWVKNIVVLFPLFFGHKMTDPVLLLRCVVTAVLFCLMASAVYCFNDVCDRDTDRRHPLKCRRPVAAGVISARTALVIMLGMLLLVAAFCIVAPMVSPWFAGFLMLLPLFAFYLLLNIAYSLWLKHVAVVDVLVLASFYVIRLYAGSMATGIVNSRWIVLMTFLLALLLGIGKRRDDIVRHAATGDVLLHSTMGYSIPFVDAAMGVVGGVTIVCYIMYTMSTDVMTSVGSEYLYTTSIFVIAAVLRFLQLAIIKGESGDPSRLLLTDRFLHLCVLCWICCFLFFIYL